MLFKPDRNKFSVFTQYTIRAFQVINNSGIIIFSTFGVPGL